MEAPDFWDNAEASQMKMKQLKSLKDDIETYHNLETQMEDMETMIEMGYEENDPEIVPEIQEMLDEFQASFDSIRVKTLLSGEYDGENAIIKLNAGAGGTEACDWCGKLLLGFLLFQQIQLGLQHLHGLVLVHVLRTFILALYHDSCWETRSVPMSCSHTPW